MSVHPTGIPAFIALGSNIEPEKHVILAMERLGEHTPIVAVSTVYRTEALGHPGQPDFLNAVCLVTCDVPAREMKHHVLRPIEAGLGRVRTADKYAPRPIDLDIVLFGDEVICDGDLVIPDPDLRERPFLAFPVLELAPDLILPDCGLPLREVARGMRRDSLVPEVEVTNTIRKRLAA